MKLIMNRRGGWCSFRLCGVCGERNIFIIFTIYLILFFFERCQYKQVYKSKSNTYGKEIKEWKLTGQKL
ncbi:MAG: hypothetical protein OIN89_09140, partial [Candidatus Methanoperedens sp.]|nr:hypothetical protein [Candidatus Methanoperedens sp.]